MMRLSLSRVSLAGKRALTSRPAMTKAAGWTAVALGAVHLAVAVYGTRQTWSRVADDGWWNTFTIDEVNTAPELKRSETFWVTVGSCGAPMLVFGSHVLWAAHQGQRVPGWVGWGVLAWGVPFVVTLPKSPGWVIPVIGGLVVLGDRRRGAVTPGAPQALPGVLKALR